jgi:hypothetical protein
MKNLFKYNSVSRYRLIGKINGLADLVKRTHSRLVVRAGQKKPISSLMGRKLAVSVDIRHHLLAYAFMKGVPYVKLEAKCREDNKPSVDKILEIINSHVLWRSAFPIDAKNVSDWLAGVAQ